MSVPRQERVQTIYDLCSQLDKDYPQGEVVANSDHYASLGVSRTSEDVVIRAAYLALMRRYHPDGNPSPEAAARVRTITMAYAVLGDAAKRREYDSGWVPDARYGPTKGVRPIKVGPLVFGLTMLCMCFLVMAIMTRSPSRGEAAPGPPPASLPGSNSTPAKELSCLSEETKALIPRELIRRAADLTRGSPRDFAKFLEVMSVRTAPALTMSEPRTGFLECAASVTLPMDGTQTSAGSTPVFGDVDFTVIAGKSGAPSLIEFNPDERFLLQLASLHQAAQAQVKSPPNSDIPLTNATSVARSREPRLMPPVLKAGRGMSAVNMPPLDSRRTLVVAAAEHLRQTSRSKEPLPARTRDPCRGDAQRQRPCLDDNLKILDQQLAIFERQSIANSNPRKRELLNQTRDRFEAGRGTCHAPACERRLILSRTTEIADIMRSGAHLPH